jgi:hypothetical protein
VLLHNVTGSRATAELPQLPQAQGERGFDRTRWNKKIEAVAVLCGHQSSGPAVQPKNEQLFCPRRRMRFRNLVSLQQGDRAATRLGSKTRTSPFPSCTTDLSPSCYWSHVQPPASRLSAQRPTSPACKAPMTPGPRLGGPGSNQGSRKPPGRAGTASNLWTSVVTHVVESMRNASLDFVPCGTMLSSTNITSQLKQLQKPLLREARALLRPRACRNHATRVPARYSAG